MNVSCTVSGRNC